MLVCSFARLLVSAILFWAIFFGYIVNDASHDIYTSNKSMEFPGPESFSRARGPRARKYGRGWGPQSEVPLSWRLQLGGRGGSWENPRRASRHWGTSKTSRHLGQRSRGSPQGHGIPDSRFAGDWRSIPIPGSHRGFPWAIELEWVHRFQWIDRGASGGPSLFFCH